MTKTTVLGILVVFVIGVEGVAGQVADEATVTLGDVGQGSLLLASETAGRYIPAPVQATEVEVSVRGLMAEAEVRQRFSNPATEWVEGVYVFPLPPRAAVFGMRLEVGERVIEGRIEEREAARQVYRHARDLGKKASLVEQERANIFTTAVANIGPGEEVVVRISYQQTLDYVHGRFELRFPMVVGPRYIPGVGLERRSSGTGWAFDTDQVPDASRITPPVVPPGHARVNPVQLRVTIDAGMPLESISCESHPAAVSQSDTGNHVVTLDGSFADRDFVLEWAPERGMQPRAAVFTEELDGEFYALVMVVPPADEHIGEVRLARESVFVIDTSGSMGGASIGQARSALILALDQLQPEDYFNIIEFDSSYSQLFAASRPAMPAAVDEAKQWVGRLGAGGGTEMARPLLAALADRSPLTPLRQIVFITDGCVGNEAALFDAIHRELGRSRLFTVGIGSAPNSHFMVRAAEVGRGSFTHIGHPGEVEVRMRELFSKLEDPVMADIELHWPDPSAEVWPRLLPDLYAGEPLVVAARLDSVSGELVATGVRADAVWEQRVPLEIGAVRSGVNRLWARRKIASLMLERARGVPEAEIRPRVLETALAHNLVSTYTSLVAVDVTPVRPAGEALHGAAVPTNLPAGWEYDKVFGVMPQGGTGSRLHLLVALLMLCLAGALRLARWV